jgi:hypothetical protein
VNADTNYSFNPWMAAAPRQGDNVDPSPALGPVETIQGIMDLNPLPPPAGYTQRLGYENREPTIMDVLTIGPNVLMRDTPTRQESGMQGTMRPAAGTW